MNKKEVLQIPNYAVKAEERIRWSDLDAAGIMYFGQYIRLFEIGETELFRHVGFPYTNTQFEELGVWMLRVNFSCDFHAPAMIDDLLDIYCWPEIIGGASLRLRFAVKKSELVLGDGSCTIVSVDKETRKAVKLPEQLREKMEKLISGSRI
ncbi:MAG: acyl-CoA thioesterase [Bacteroidota bacterium]|nr:acyl-CoA thioesterase [bacterium]NBP63971.1 acyl-CoA thioesterase [Bacteroidota bacterium]